MRLRFVLLTLLLVCCRSNAQAPNDTQSLAANYRPAREQFTISKDVNRVNLLFTTDRPAASEELTVPDISIWDDDKPPAELLSLRTERELPLRLGLLIDTSDSVKPSFRFEQAAATAFVRALIQQPEDMGLIQGFAHRPSVTQAMTHEPDLLSRGIASLRTGGDTALFDAVQAACRGLVRGYEDAPVARVLVVLTDGDDTSSRSHLEDAIAFAQQSEVTIYTIGTQYTWSSPLLVDSSAKASRALQHLAEDTGGRSFSAGRVHGLARTFAKIQNDLRQRYALLYIPADFRPDGHFRRIKVQVRKAGQKIRVHARKGYYAQLIMPNP